MNSSPKHPYGRPVYRTLGIPDVILAAVYEQLNADGINEAGSISRLIFLALVEYCKDIELMTPSEAKDFLANAKITSTRGYSKRLKQTEHALNSPEQTDG